MKTFFTLTLYCFVLLNTSHGQNITLQVQGGTNLTRLSSFKHKIFIVDQGFIVPGIIEPINSNDNPIMAVSEASTSVAPGFFVNLEAFYYKDRKNSWEFSSSVELVLWRFNFDNSISREKTLFFNISYYDMNENNMGERLNALESESLNQLSGSYGEVQTLYIEFQPFNISRHFFRRQFSLQTGPVISFNLDKENHKSTAIKYNKGSNHTWDEIDDAYFAGFGFEKVMPGWKLRLCKTISDKFSVFVSTKYYFTPSFETFSSPLKYNVYHYDNNGEIIDVETKVIDKQGPLPLQFQAGISYDVWSIGKQNKDKY